MLMYFCLGHRREEISQVYNTPLLELIFRAATVHRMYNDPSMVCLRQLLIATASSISACSREGSERYCLGSCVQVQRCTLLSIKTGGCPETCTYCSQSSSWRKETGLKAEKLMDLEEVYQVTEGVLASNSRRHDICRVLNGTMHVVLGSIFVLYLSPHMHDEGNQACKRFKPETDARSMLSFLHAVLLL